MSNKEKFTALLEKYLSGDISASDHMELMLLIKSGKYDHLLKKYIGQSFSDENAAIDLDNSKAGDLLNRILNSEKQTARLIPLANSQRRFHRWYAVAAAVLVISLAIWGFVFRNDKTQPVVVKAEKEKLQPAPATKGKRYIRLQDGSTVLLNEGSSIDYPDEFAVDRREVNLIGEAYFDIRPDAKRPFIVHTGTVSTTVLGTAFNIKAYPEQKKVTVTVTRGKVKVGNSKKTFGIIVPNESIAVNTEINTYKLERVNAENAVAWKKQYLVLDDISMEEAAILINNKYHVNISFSREALKQCRISATFLNNENLDQVLSVVTGVVDADYTIQPNDQVIINGEGCK